MILCLHTCIYVCCSRWEVHQDMELQFEKGIYSVSNLGHDILSQSMMNSNDQYIIESGLYLYKHANISIITSHPAAGHGFGGRVLGAWASGPFSIFLWAIICDDLSTVYTKPILQNPGQCNYADVLTWGYQEALPTKTPSVT